MPRPWKHQTEPAIFHVLFAAQHCLIVIGFLRDHLYFAFHFDSSERLSGFLLLVSFLLPSGNYQYCKILNCKALQEARLEPNAFGVDALARRSSILGYECCSHLTSLKIQDKVVDLSPSCKLVPHASPIFTQQVCKLIIEWSVQVLQIRSRFVVHGRVPRFDHLEGAHLLFQPIVHEIMRGTTHKF